MKFYTCSKEGSGYYPDDAPITFGPYDTVPSDKTLDTLEYIFVMVEWDDEGGLLNENTI